MLLLVTNEKYVISILFRKNRTLLPNTIYKMELTRVHQLMIY